MIAIVGAVLCLAEAIYCFLPVSPHFLFYSGIVKIFTKIIWFIQLFFQLYVFHALVYLSIIYAQYKRQPSYYLPYLIIQVCSIQLLTCKVGTISSYLSNNFGMPWRYHPHSVQFTDCGREKWWWRISNRMMKKSILNFISSSSLSASFFSSIP